LHGEFLRLLPERPQPIKVQRWTFRRLVAALVAAVVLILLALNMVQLSGIGDNTHTAVGANALCDQMEPMWLQAQAVPTAERVPCVTSLPVGWAFGELTVNNGRSTITVNHDRAGPEAISLRFADSCDVTNATEVVADVAGARRFERGPVGGTSTLLTWYEVFPGGCTTVRLSSRNAAPEVLQDVTAQAGRVIGFVSRFDLARALDERSNGRLRLDPPSPSLRTN
jgi:hypothetical protein